MLSYQHAYHAGCYADVLKHLVLVKILNYMTQKDNPILYLETHGGRGFYNLHDDFSKKTGEAQEGIQKLWDFPTLDPVFDDFIALLKSQNQKDLVFYPGSPWIAQYLLRDKDRLFISEWHKGEFEHLKQLKTNKKFHIECTDGMKTLQSLLPPPEKRSLVFIDPSYELKTEYKEIPQHIAKAYKKFNQGVYCLWYPIVQEHYHKILLTKLNHIQAAKFLRVEVYLKESKGMQGTGLFIINPPYILKEQLEKIIKILTPIFDIEHSILESND